MRARRIRIIEKIAERKSWKKNVEKKKTKQSSTVLTFITKRMQRRKLA